MMVMATFSMSMAVGQLLWSGITNSQELYIKYQILARQRVISIQLDLILLDLDYPKQENLPIGSRGLKLVAFLKIRGVRKLLAGHLNNQLIIHDSIGISGCHFDLPLVTHTEERQSAFESGDDLPHAFQIGKGNILVA
jgi:hypothetical protein